MTVMGVYNTRGLLPQSTLCFSAIFAMLMFLCTPLFAHAGGSLLVNTWCVATAFFGHPCEKTPTFPKEEERSRAPSGLQLQTAPAPSVNIYQTYPVTVVYKPLSTQEKTAGSMTVEYQTLPPAPAVAGAATSTIAYTPLSLFKKQVEKLGDNIGDRIAGAVKRLEEDLRESFETAALVLTGSLTDGTGSTGSSGYLLQSTGSGVAWVATSTIGDSTSLEDLNDVASMVQATGDLLLWDGTAWTSAATATLGHMAPADIDTSAELADVLTDETGTGNAVFSNSPTVTGVATLANASTTNLSIANRLYVSSLVDGCVEMVSGRLTSIGANCGTGSGGITSLNGLTNSSQTFATSTSGGIDLRITSGAGVHTFTANPTSGYSVPLTASTTNWNAFYNTPSTRIADGIGLTWSGATLSVDDAYLLNTGDTATGNYTFDTDTFFIDAGNNRVGIGTTTPAQTLSVSGAVEATGAIGSGRPSDHWTTTNSYYGVGNVGQLDTHGSYRVSLTSNGYRDSGGTWTSLGANGNVGAAQIELDPTGFIAFKTDVSKTTGSSVSVSERLRIDSAGNVGIGDTTPSYLLDIAGDARATSKIWIKDSGTIGSVALASGSGTNTGYLEWRLPADDGALGTRLGYLGWSTSNVALTLENGSDFTITGGNMDVNGSLEANTLTENGSAVLSVGNLDTCAEFAALGSIETGSCGSLVFSVSPTLTGTLTSDAANFSGNVNVSSAAQLGAEVIRAVDGNGIAIGGGETYPQLDSNMGTAEYVWLGGESGIKIISSSDNWAGGWATRNEATLVDSGGNSSFPGDVTVQDLIMTGQTINGRADNNFVIKSDTDLYLDLDDDAGNNSDLFIRDNANAVAFQFNENGAFYAPSLTASEANSASFSTLCYRESDGLFIADDDSVCISSSARFKHDIAELDIDGLSYVRAMKPSSYIYNEGEDQSTFYGLIAEDIAAIDPHLADYDPEGLPEDFYDRAVLAVVVKAVQELDVRTELMAFVPEEEMAALWKSMTTLAQNFVDGALTITGIKVEYVQSDKVETKELCVGSVCVDEDTFLEMAELANSTYALEQEEESEEGTELEAEEQQPPAEESSVEESEDTGVQGGTDDQLGSEAQTDIQIGGTEEDHTNEGETAANDEPAPTDGEEAEQEQGQPPEEGKTNEKSSVGEVTQDVTTTAGEEIEEITDENTAAEHAGV